MEEFERAVVEAFPHLRPGYIRYIREGQVLDEHDILSPQSPRRKASVIIAVPMTTRRVYSTAPGVETVSIRKAGGKLRPYTFSRGEGLHGLKQAVAATKTWPIEEVMLLHGSHEAEESDIGKGGLVLARRKRAAAVAAAGAAGAAAAAVHDDPSILTLFIRPVASDKTRPYTFFLRDSMRGLKQAIAEKEGWAVEEVELRYAGDIAKESDIMLGTMILIRKRPAAHAAAVADDPQHADVIHTPSYQPETSFVHVFHTGRYAWLETGNWRQGKMGGSRGGTAAWRQKCKGK